MFLVSIKFYIEFQYQINLEFLILVDKVLGLTVTHRQIIILFINLYLQKALSKVMGRTKTFEIFPG